MRELIRRAQASYDDNRSQDALLLLEPLGWSPESGAPSRPLIDALLLRIRCLIRLERFREGFRLADQLATPEPPSYRTSELLRLRGVLWRLARRRYDRAILDLAQARELGGDEALRALAGAELAHCLAEKGCIQSALDAIELAAAEHPSSAPVPYRHGLILLALRDFDGARDQFEALAKLPDGRRLAHDGLAFVALATGDLGAATAHLDAIGPARPDELWLRRRRLQLLPKLDPEAEPALLAELRQASPGSDHGGRDRLREAELAYLAGEPDRAAAAVGELVADPDVPLARRARRLLRALDRCPPGQRPDVVRLQGVPFIAGARHPGAAAIELALATLGRRVDSDMLPEVMSIGGAAEFLALAGLPLVRFAGGFDQIASLIEVGAPVLLAARLRPPALVVAVDRTRRALALREEGGVATRTIDEEELPLLLGGGALAALPAGVDSPVPNHDELSELDVAARLLDQGQERAASARLERLCETLGSFPLPWELLLEADMLQLEQPGGPLSSPGEPDSLGFEPEGAEAELTAARVEQRLESAAQACGEAGWLDTQRAHLLELRGELGAAAELYERAVDPDQDDVELIARAADVQVDLGRAEVAERLLWRGLEREPANVSLNIGLAGLYCDEEDLPLARHFVGVALELAPDDADSLLNLGRLRELEGDAAAAANAYEQALSRERRDPSYLLEKLGVTLAAQGRWGPAIDRLQQAVAIKEISGELNLSARLTLADVMMRAGDPTGALAVTERALERAPDQPGALAVSGVALVEQGQPQAGIERLQRALEIEPDGAWARQQLAVAYHRSGEIEQAEALLREAVERHPEDGFAQHQLAAILRDRRDLPGAADVLRRACRLDGYRDDSLLALLVDTLHELGEADEAVEHATIALQRGGSGGLGQPADDPEEGDQPDGAPADGEAPAAGAAGPPELAPPQPGAPEPDAPSEAPAGPLGPVDSPSGLAPLLRLSHSAQRVRRICGRVFAEHGRWDALELLVEEELAREPDDPEWLLLKARVARQNGRKRPVEELVELALDADGSDDESLYHQVAHLIELDQLDAAQATFERARDIGEPALCRMGLRVYANAPRFLPRCLELALAGNRATMGRDGFFLTQVALHASALGHREQARQAAQEAIALDPSEPWAYCLLAQTLTPQGRFREALALIDKAETRGESGNFCDWCRLDVYLEARQWEAVATVSGRLAEREADEPRQQARMVGVQAALALEGEEGFARAVAEIEAELPLSGSQLGRLAGVAFDDGRWVLARATVERALAADPRSEPALALLAMLRARVSDMEGAEAALEELLEVNPASARGHELLGLLRIREGQLDEALGSIRAAVEFEPRSPTGWAALGRMRCREDQPEQGLPALERAQSLAPRRRYAEIDQALIAWLGGDILGAEGWLARAESHREALGPLWGDELDWAAARIRGEQV